MGPRLLIRKLPNNALVSLEADLRERCSGQIRQEEREGINVMQGLTNQEKRKILRFEVNLREATEKKD